MKKMLLATALALLLGCAQQTFTVQNKPAAVAPETITHHFFVSGIGQKEKLSMQPKFVAAQKMLLKQKPSKHSCSRFCSVFITLSIFILKHGDCAHNNAWGAHRYIGQLSIYFLINILLGSFQLFLHIDQPL